MTCVDCGEPNGGIGGHLKGCTFYKPPDRPETGPMQFGDDWPGVFIRGDNAAFMNSILYVAWERLAELPGDTTWLRGQVENVMATIVTALLFNRLI